MTNRTYQEKINETRTSEAPKRYFAPNTIHEIEETEGIYATPINLTTKKPIKTMRFNMITGCMETLDSILA